VGDLDRAPGAPTAGMMPVGPTNDLEDPPGLYEKVRKDYDINTSILNRM